MILRHRLFIQVLRTLSGCRVPQMSALLPLPSLLSQPKHDQKPLPSSANPSALQLNDILCRTELQTATHVSTSCTLFFLTVFLLGARSALQEPNIHTARHSRLSDLEPFRYSEPPIQHQLHEYHSVPKKYLRLMSIQQQHELLLLLSCPATNSSLALPNRRAVFTLISGCRLHSCLRALASAATYAQVTGRVAVIYVKEMTGMKLTEVVKMKPHGVLNHNAIVVSLNKDVHYFHESSVSSTVDWAEFSVIHAVAPSTYSLKMTASNSLNGNESHLTNPKKHDDEASSHEEEEYLPKIGNTKNVATLDNLAAVNSHISVSLNEVVWSSYSPRSVQEGLFANTLVSADGISEKLVETASLLGRRQETRNIEITEERLSELFKIPRMLMKGMTPLGKKLLLLKLESKTRRGNLNPRVLFVHTQYGLGNRLRALGSAMAFARRTDRILILIWVPDQHLNCRYTDLFVGNDEFVVSDSFEPGEGWPFRSNGATDVNMKDVKWYNFMRVNGRQVNSPTDPVTDDKEYHIYVSTCYVIQSPVTPFIIRTTSSFWVVLRSLTPQVDVLRLVERFSSYPISEMIGIHIRGKSIKADISGVTATDYSKESSRTTDFWRNLTQVDTFIEEMRRQPVDQLFYVAADSKDVFNRLQREFPSRVYYTPRTCDSRDRECLPFALADILLLAKCSSLRGSYWSSFSELSTRIGGARFLLAGIDFGRPERQLF